MNSKIERALRKYAAPAVGALAVIGGSAHAAAPDFTSLTTAVDFSTVVTAVLAVGAAIALVKVAIAGGRKVLSMIR